MSYLDPANREGLTPHDFSVQDEGTIIVLHPANDAASGWIQENLYGDEASPVWWGGGVVIERRLFPPIFDALVDEEFLVVAR